MPYNSVADSFYTKKLCKKTFFKQIKQSATLRKNRRFCVFETPFGGLRGNVRGDDHLRLIGKRVRDFLLALIEFIEFFFARCYG